MVELFVFAVRLTVPPTHIGALVVIPVDDGTGFTDTVVVYVLVPVHPPPVPVTVSEYVLVTLGVAVGFAIVVEERLGPLHAQLVTEGFVFAYRFTVPPAHIVPLLVRPLEVGIGFTDTVVV